LIFYIQTINIPLLSSEFFGNYYAKEKEIPQWIVDSMEAAKICLDDKVIE